MLRKYTESFSVACNPADIRIGNLSNTILDSYRFNNLLSFIR